MLKFHERRLPHLYAEGKPIFLTWRLHGSLPANRAFPGPITSGKAFLAMDRLLDKGSTGPLFLAQPEIAKVIVHELHFREQELNHYTLHAWVVMANHVHLLITPHLDVAKIMHSLKRFTTRKCNSVLARTGQPFWQEESFDRLVRSKAEFEEIARYIEMNPVTAGLADTPESFAYTSVRPITNQPQVANRPHPFC